MKFKVLLKYCPCLFVVLLLLFLNFSYVSAYYLFRGRVISTKFYWFICFTCILLAGLRPAGSDRDYFTYLDHFDNYNNVILLEPTFKALAYAVHLFGNSHYLFLFVIYAILGISLKFIALKKCSIYLPGSLLIYLSNYFLLHDMTQIRVGVASAFLLLSIKPLYDKNLKHFALMALCATLFHYSAVIIFALWFLRDNSSKLLWLILPLIAFALFLLNVNLLLDVPIPILHDKILTYQNLKYTNSIHNEINVFNAVYLLKLFLFYLIGLKYNYLSNIYCYFTLLFRIYALSLSLFLLLSDIPVLAYRLSELLGIVEILLLPLLIYLFKPVYLSKVCFFLFCLIILFINEFHNQLIT